MYYRCRTQGSQEVAASERTAKQALEAEASILGAPFLLRRLRNISE
jgi:hypothetical protein